MMEYINFYLMKIFMIASYYLLGDIMIGVLLRDYDDKYTLNKEIKNVISIYHKSFLAIHPSSLEEFKQLTKLCDGFILQGGKDYTKLEIEMIRYLYENNIPTLGICLGMQMMGVMNGTIELIGNNYHQSKEKYVHEIIINENSKLYSILKQKKIWVNSRHIERITNTSLDIVAYALDGTIEAVEDQNKKFFIGVQWHPESIMDENSIKIFDCFFNS